VSGADYFSFTNLTAGTTARAGDVNSRMAAIQAGFAHLPHYEKIQQGRSTAVTDTGAANALVVALDFAPASYVFGMELTVRVAVTNTGPSTVNVNGLGAKSIVRADGSALQAGDLTAGRIIHLVFDGSNFQDPRRVRSWSRSRQRARQPPRRPRRRHRRLRQQSRRPRQPQRQQRGASEANAATSRRRRPLRSAATSPRRAAP
jgi:hypothetical protein